MVQPEWTSDYWMQAGASLAIDQWPTFILLKPQLPLRAVLVSKLMRVAQHTLVYAVSPTELSLEMFLHGLVAMMTEIYPGQRLALSNALTINNNSAAQCAEALSDDLARLKVSCLVVDNSDCLDDSAATGEFFTQLGACLGAAQKIIVNGRTLPLARWMPLIRDGKAVVIGDEKTPSGPLYTTTEANEQRHVEVSGLAGGLVQSDGLPIDEWDGPLPRNLFFYLIDHYQGVSREDIFATFWPKLNKKEATNVFHVSKGKIAERIGAELTEYRRNYYFPAQQVRLHYDVAHFEEMVRQARMASSRDAIGFWAEAVRVYRQEFLSPYDLAWIKPRRDELRTMFAEALICLAQHYQSQGEAQIAISFFTRALREAPDREDVYRAVIELYAENGRLDKATAQYERLAERLKKTWGVKPSPATHALYERIAGQSKS